MIDEFCAGTSKYSGDFVTVIDDIDSAMGKTTANLMCT